MLDTCIHAPVPACRALPAPGSATEDSSVASSSTAPLHTRVTELETELARVYEQLQEAETHLVQAEAGIRDEVVCEIQVGRLVG
jgi:hypothetical protein